MYVKTEICEMYDNKTGVCRLFNITESYFRHLI